jgi:hypothetical protein
MFNFVKKITTIWIPTCYYIDTSILPENPRE